ncbi:tetratricopeptide repeat protein [Pseudanabaena sp. PCC 6802]|uniref:tetratricopeptide repeat protein n=1 Tax=Pseudanabaena sp. PCC 6802 TaxID=118173 RepID=UPI00036BC4F6|nr:tetratricopeptide repeat protein [Pseudanabaena sp. PCC 6802]
MTVRDGELDLLDVGVQHVDVLLGRAIASQKSGQIGAAECLYLQILKQQPDQIDALQNLGTIACQQQQFERGINLLSQAIAIAPDRVGIHTNLALAYIAMGDLDAAIPHYQKVIDLQPDCTPAYLRLSQALIERSRLAEAQDYLERLLARQPDCADAYWDLCAILRQTDRYALWRQTAEQYMRFCQDSDAIGAAIATIQAYYKTGMHAEALQKLEELEAQIYRDAGELSDTNIGRIYFLILFAIFRLRDDLEANSKLAKLIGQLYAKSARKTIDAIPRKSLEPDRDRDNLANSHSQQDRLRIGFMSVNFRRHPVGWCIADALQSLSRLAPHIYLYATSEFKRDDRTEVFENIASKCNWKGNRWQQQTQSETFKNLNDLIAEIEEDNLDVLIDLDSLTASRHPEILVRKPARLCLSWLGFDAPFLSTDNYNLGDRHTHPAGIEPYYLETIIRLPDSHMAVAGFASVPVDRQAQRKAIGIKAQEIAYLCVTPSIKLNYPTVEAHARILKSIPDSRLLYKGRGDLEVVKSLYHQICINYNLDRDRIKFLPLTATEEEHRGSYAIADVLLDSYPYNGGSHTLEALWFNLPIVTRMGEQSFSRMGYSFLTTLGITDGIARNWDEYVEWGIRLGQDRALRDAIEKQLLASKQPDRLSPLWNPDKLARDMYGMFESVLAGQRDSDAAIYFELGNNLWHRGNVAESAMRYRQAIALQPDRAEAWGNLGTVLHSENKLEEAIAHYQKSLRLNSHNLTIQSNLGKAFKALGQDDLAIACYERALEIDPQNLHPYNRLGEIFFARRDWQKARDCFQQAIEIDPNYAFSLNRLGAIHLEWQRVDEAIIYFERAIGCDPEFVNAHVNYSLALLLKGEYRAGFVEYEWRWQEQEFLAQNPTFSTPVWDGSDLQDRTLLIYAEQGLGDFIQFIRYLPLVKAKCSDRGKILVTCPASIIPLLSDSNDLIKDVDLIAVNSPLPPFDLCAPLLSLPRILGTAVSNIPSVVPYLFAKPDRMTIPERSQQDRLRIGVVWATCSASSETGKRSCPLELFQRLIDSNLGTFYSLQMEIPPADEDLFERLGDRIVDLRDCIQNFADTAAIVEQMDLIISIDTAVAHLAGAMGKPVWLLLPFAADWRWMLEREDSPWYPTMRLFRQARSDDWAGVMGRLVVALRDFMRGEVIVRSESEPLNLDILNLDILLQTAIAHHQAGRRSDAVEVCKIILDRQPDNFNALYLMGLLTYAEGRWLDAQNYIERTIALKSDHAEAYKKLGDIFKEKGERQAAIAAYKRAITLKPKYVNAYYALGCILGEQEDYPELVETAIVNFQQALTLKPDYAIAHYGLGLCYKSLNQLDRAIAAFQQSVFCDPKYTDAHVALGLTLLLAGNFAPGWQEYEWRWDAIDIAKESPHLFPEPVWDGSDFRDRTLLIYAEQGHGDLIQFIRYVPLVRDKGGRVLLACPQELISLCACLEEIQLILWDREKALERDKLAFDIRVPLLSLPRILGTTIDTIPNRIPYLSVPLPIKPHLQIASQERLKVGLVWATHSASQTAKRRSCPLPLLERIWEIEGIAFYSLQTEISSLERERLAGKVQDLSPYINDFADTAILIEQMDLVISVDTAVAHLAGALGKPVWVLLKFHPDWRWLLEREDSPWYPTMRLFRQLRSNDWEGVIARVVAALQEFRSGDEMSIPNSQLPTSTQSLDIDSHAKLQTAIAHQQAGRLDEAAQIYQQILQQHPDDFNALYLAGVVALRQNHLTEAVSYLQRTIALKSDHAEAHRKLGDIFKQQRQPEEAIAAYRQAIACKPDYCEAHYFIGIVFWNQDNFEQAAFHYRRATEIKPDYAAAHGNLGAALFKLGKTDEAIACYHRALQLDPHDLLALCNLATALADLGKLDEAIEHCQTAIQIQPDSQNAHCNLAYVYQCQGNTEKAIAAYQKVIDLNPNHIDAHIGLGNMYSNLQQYERAIDEFNRAIAIDSSNANAYNWLGFVCLELNQVDAAIEAFRHAINYNPDYPEAHLNLSLALLLQGNYAEGLAEYEWRSQRSGLDKDSPHFFPHPVWDGQDLQGRTLLIYSEQGFGDLIQFIRYIPIAKARCGSNGKIIFDCQEPVRRLFEPFIDKTGIEIRPRNLPLPHFDIRASLLSLPHILGTTLDTIPAPEQYLSIGKDINPEAIRKIGERRSLLKVGLVWASKQTHSTAPKRSCHLSSLLPLFDLVKDLANGQTNIHFYVLQKEISDADRPLMEQYQAELTDLSNYLGDFADTAAIIDRLDLVITVDTSVAHLAGAMGKPVWVMLPLAPDWRWLLEREDSPWYPTMRLFRQDKTGDWQGAIERIAIAVRELLSIDLTNSHMKSAKSSKSSKPTKPSKSSKKSNKRNKSPYPVESPLPNLDILIQEAIAHHKAGKLAEAEVIYQQILQLQPQHFTSLHMLGVLALQAGQLETGISWIKKAVAVDPTNAEAHSNLGNALSELERHDEAISHYERAIALNPDFADAYYNLGLANAARGDIDKAIACYQQTIAISPTYAQAHNNLGTLLQKQGQFEQAKDCYQQAIAINPNHAEAKYNFSMLLLLLGDLRQGFLEYEWRWRSPTFLSDNPAPSCSQPLWDGTDLDRRTLLISCEQGFGDAIQFSRYFSLIKRKAEKVMFVCPPPLEKLFRQFDGVKLVPPHAPLPDFDTHISLLSLPRICDTALATIPARIPYLSAPSPEEIASLLKIDDRTNTFRVGIVWASKASHPTAGDRTCPLNILKSLLDISNVNFYCLQKEIDNSDRHLLGQYQGKLTILSDRLQDFADTAAIIAQLDLVISVDTAVAHLAGAMGKPTWVLLPFSPDWRWMLEREDSPWYPTMRLFRQERIGDWTDAIERVGNALRDLTNSGSRTLDAISSVSIAMSIEEKSEFLSVDDLNLDDLIKEAIAHHKAGKLTDAERLYRRILQHHPQHFNALHMLGTLASQLGQLETGITYIQQALTLNPQSAEAHSNLGSAYSQQGNLEKAILHYRSAISLKPDYADAHKNLGLALLAAGNLQEGFREYEWRWQSDSFKQGNPLPNFVQPLWDGTDAKERTLLIYCEQGLGDIIQFSRYIPLIASKVGKVILDCREPLNRLLGHTFRTLENLQIAQRNVPLPQFDLRIPLVSLARILGTTLETIPAQIPYLSAPQDTSGIAAEISQHKARLKVGLVWASQPGHSTTATRSCPLELFLKLLDIPDIKFYSLQKEVSDRDVEILEQNRGKLQDLRHYLGDFADTAAIVQSLDLVISIDTSVAHLAGALGKPVWVLLPHVADWRWLQGREDSPWYSTMRLFRQPQPERWDAVITRVVEELNTSIAQYQNRSYNLKLDISSTVMTKQNIGLNMTIGSPTGWGVVSTNLLLQILKSDRFSPYLIAAPDFNTGFVNPLYRHAIAPLISEQRRLQQIVSSNANKLIYVDFPIIHVLDNSKPKYELRIRGKQNYGYAVFESSHLSPEKIDSFNNFDLILVASTWNANILHNYGLTNVRLAIQGIDPAIFHPAPRSDLFRDRFVIFSGGKLEFRKGQDIVVAAFKIFQSRHPDALLITAWHNFWPIFMAGIEKTGNVVGLPASDSNQNLKIAEWLANNGLPPNSYIDLGLVPNHITPQIVREADVALFPNRCEGGTNLVAMECLACGVPTVLSANTGHLDLIGDLKDIEGGTIRHCYPLRHQKPVMRHPHFSGVEGWGESDVEEVVEVLEQIYNDRTEAKLRGAKGTLFMQGMTWEKQVEKILDAIATKIST